MHETQQKILHLAKTQDLSQLSLRQIGASVGVQHPQKVKYHLEKLIERGLMTVSLGRNKIQHVPTRQEKDGLFAIPILGSANAGPATVFAEGKVEGQLRISKKLLPRNTEQLFAVRVAGNSMCRATINGKRIEDGDLVVVDADNNSPNNGSLVLSVIGEVANIKRFTKDEQNRQIILSSESDQDFAPIYIHDEDQSDYLVAGVVVDVFKKPTID